MSNLGRLTVGSLIGGVLVAILLLPYAAAAGLGATQVAQAVEGTDTVNMNLPAPERTVIQDKNGKPFAYLYDQNRTWVPFGDISQYLKDSIVSIEDRRFFDHFGVDWRGTARAALGQVAGKSSAGGGSTITQQYVKNYLYLIAAKTDADKAQAIESTPIRKLKEARIAINLEATVNSKNKILESYLNTVAFAPSVYGAEAASQYFFGKSAKNLELGEAAMLAGMVNNPNRYNPFNPDRIDDVMSRRDKVLNALVRDKKYSQATIAPLLGSKLPINQTDIPNGCISADTNSTLGTQGIGYFCQYVLNYLTSLPDKPFTEEQLKTGGYTITTTLDPDVMTKALTSVNTNAGDVAGAASRIADVLAIVEPGTTNTTRGRPVLALAVNRPYGLKEGQTVQKLATTFVPLGAGSTFKIFTAAAAMNNGVGTADVIDSPPVYTSPLAKNKEFKNAGEFPATMPLEQALATSPNTAFVSLEDQVGLAAVADMAVAMGLRGYSLDAGQVEPGFADLAGSYRDQITQQAIASFTLGVTPVSPLDLASVGATIASNGMWCPPTPVGSITDRNDAPVDWSTIPCEQVVPKELAQTLALAMEGDIAADGSQGYTGTAHASFEAGGWNMNNTVAGKTGTTQEYKSSAFLGFTPAYSGASLVWDFEPSPQPICQDPLSTCTFDEITAGSKKGMSGGSVPAKTWVDAMAPLYKDRAKEFFGAATAQYKNGLTKKVPDLLGKSTDDARAELVTQGYINDPTSVIDVFSDAPVGQVVDYHPRESAVQGAIVTLIVSKGKAATG
ncbi:transglycosylase domain-containing protein [Nakamurella antarctica]|nr:transglycosylase domain-containing protein [Nakamurella antarctica]